MAVLEEKIGRCWIGSDWHADYSIYVQAKKIMGPEDRLVYLGDAFDKGPCPFKLFLALMRDPQVTFLMGNHEEFAYRTLMMVDNYDVEDKDLWFMNGGSTAYHQFYNIQNSELVYEVCDYLNKVYNRSYLKVEKVNNKTFFLCHAGFTFGTGTYNPEINYVWDRNHIYDKNPNPPVNAWIIHGHTPVQMLPWNKRKKEIEIDNYSPQKIDIDLATWRSKKAALLPLDDLDNPIYITSNDSLNEDPENYTSIVR